MVKCKGEISPFWKDFKMRKYFFTGLVILLPLTVTIAIATFVVNFLTKPFMGMVTHLLSSTKLPQLRGFFLSSEQLLRYGSQMIILIALFAFTLLLGIIARWFIFRAFFAISDKVLHKIPLVNKVYKTTQDIIKTLFSSEKNSFKQVVMVPFPYPGNYALGLVSRESPEACEEKLQAKMVSVFIPTTPNPTTGFLLMFKQEDLIFVDMKTEDAIKYIVSCGVIIPEKKEVNPIVKGVL